MRRLESHSPISIHRLVFTEAEERGTMGSAMVKEEARPNGDDVVAVVADLPISIISDILSRLPVDDLARCKAVGKSWYELSKDPHFTRLHFTTSSQHTTNNGVLLWKADRYDSTDIWLDMAGGQYLIRNNKNGKWKSFTLSPEADPELVSSMVSVEASCNGLLCLNTYLCNAKGPDLVYNPLTKEAIALPQLNFHPDYERRGYGYKSTLGFDPINNKYKLVVSYKRKFYLDYTWTMTAAILTLGETSWRTLQFPHDLETAILGSEPLFFNGAFYWPIGILHLVDKTHLDGILLLDITTENFQIINFSPSVEIPYSNLQLVQFENSLAFACLNDDNHPSFEIWQIQGANTDGTCLYKHCTFNVQVDGFPLIDTKGFRLLGALHNGVFLFKAYQTSKKGEPLCNHLVIYDTRKDQGSVIEISRVPKYFSARIFSPSLISPTL